MKFFSLFFLFFFATIFSIAVHAQQRFTSVWHSTPWDSGGIAPNSVVWSLYDNELDLDNDGKKEFLCVTSWSDSFYNAVYLYEHNGINNFEIVWYYSFFDYSTDYSSVTVSDMDGDGKREIVCFVDPLDTSYHSLYFFEWNGNDNGFPIVPTTTWNMNLPLTVDEASAIISGNFDTDEHNELAVMFQESFLSKKTRVIIFSLDALSSFETPAWNIELNDTTTFLYSGYALASTDLDRDGKKEIVASGWDSTFHIAMFENTGVANTYSRAANIWNITNYNDFSNGGFIEANFDNNATNELYITTAAGNIFVATNSGDISTITNDNFFSIGQIFDGKGIIGVTKGDADGNGKENLYIAGSYHENILDWEYNNGDVTSASSYIQTLAFLDDTTDDVTPNSDQGFLRPSKIIAGDVDNDGVGDLLFASVSFAFDKPILSCIEYSGQNSVSENISKQHFSLLQNYPNPFNPKTAINIQLAMAGIVSLKIFNIMGQELATLIHDETMQAGKHELQFDGSRFPSGEYFYRIYVDGRISETKKMLLLK